MGKFKKFLLLPLAVAVIFPSVAVRADQSPVAVHRCRRTDSAFLFGLAVSSKPPFLIHGLTILPMAHPNQPDSLASLTDAEKIDRLKRFLDRLAEAEAFSGVVLLARKGDVLFQGASGLADREKSLPNSV